jgi:hypothetical protein
MKKKAMLWGLFGALLVTAGCAAGTERFADAPAGFWAGLWHGLICFFALVVSLFKDGVAVYEANNVGPLYDLGFVLGVAIAFGGCGRSGACRMRKAKSPKEKEWDELGARMEERVRRSIRSWLDESGKKDTEWEELGSKIEEKVKREIRDWAEK